MSDSRPSRPKAGKAATRGRTPAADFVGATVGNAAVAPATTRPETGEPRA